MRIAFLETNGFSSACPCAVPLSISVGCRRLGRVRAWRLTAILITSGNGGGGCSMGLNGVRVGRGGCCSNGLVVVQLVKGAGCCTNGLVGVEVVRGGECFCSMGLSGVGVGLRAGRALLELLVGALKLLRG